MHLKVDSYLSIAHAELQTEDKYAIIAGKNGAGKSHFLTAFLGKYLGFVTPPASAEIIASPEPRHVAFFQAERNLHPNGTLFGPARARATSRQPYLSDVFFDPLHGLHRQPTEQPAGMMHPRFSPAYFRQIIANLGRAEARWKQFAAAFHRVTDRTLMYSRDMHTIWLERPEDGRVTSGILEGFPLDPNGRSIPSWHAWSTGEKSVAMLLAEAATSSRGSWIIVDELESHLHPSLQANLVSEVLGLLDPDGFLLISTHSPAVLLTDHLRSSFWLDDATNAGRRNQLSRIGGEATVTSRIFSLYAGCSTATTVPEIMTMAYNQAFGRFLDQCYEVSDVAAEGADRDGHFQIVSVKQALLTLLAASPFGKQFRYLDFGCGEGRCLRAFSGLGADLRKRVTVTLVDQDQARLDKVATRIAEDAAQAWEGDASLGFASLTYSTELGADAAFDYIVAANVFHEIKGEAFIDAFTHVWDRLDASGMLHVLEPARLPKGEREFLVISRAGYEVFFSRLGTVPVIQETEERGGVAFNAVQVTRGATAGDGRVRDAYRAALRVTKADCLNALRAEQNQNIRRAFWLENLASVDRTLAELGDDAPAS